MTSTLYNPRAVVTLGRNERAQPATPKADGGLNQFVPLSTYDSWSDDQGAPRFAHVSVELTTGESSQCEFAVVDADFAFLDAFTRDDGVPWAAVEVQLGFGQSIKDLGAPLFRGLLASPEHSSSGPTTMRFYDMGFVMRLEQKTGIHKGTDIAIIEKLARRNGLDFEAPGDGFKPFNLKAEKQSAETDWAFASKIAEDAGLLLFVRDNTLFAKQPAHVSTPTIEFNRRDDDRITDFDFRYCVPENQEGRPRRVEHRGRGRGGGRLSATSTENERGASHVNIKRGVKGAKKIEAQRRAQNKKELKREHAFDCSLSAIMRPKERVDVRSTIRLIEFGKLFSGAYVVDSVHYNYQPGHLAADLDFYRDIKQM